MNVDTSTLLATLDGIADAVYAVDRDWRITVFNTGAEAHFGLRRETAIGQVLWDVVPGSAETALGRRFVEVMESRRPATIETGSIVLDSRLIEGRLFPLDGGMGVFFRDVTVLRRNEAELRRREAELAEVQRIAGIGGLEVDLRDGFVNRRSPEYLRLHGLPPEAANETHEAWVRRVHPDDRGRAEQAFKDAVAGTASRYVAEYRIIRPSDGELRWIAVSSEIERDPNGRALRLVGAHRDVTERKLAESRQQLLIHELNHRVKNTLATVQSIAAQSWRQAALSDGAWNAFESRLMALSRAHDILTRQNWEGADLAEIVAGATEPYWQEGQERFRVVGPVQRLQPTTALSLAMALQELATNAVKYGALSVPAGCVEVAWTTEPGDRPVLRLSWTEIGGPPVVPPSRRGFGSRLIERSLAHDLDGTVSLDFAPAGLVCRLEARLPSGPSAAGQQAMRPVA